MSRFPFLAAFIFPTSFAGFCAGNAATILPTDWPLDEASKLAGGPDLFAGRGIAIWYPPAQPDPTISPNAFPSVWFLMIALTALIIVRSLPRPRLRPQAVAAAAARSRTLWTMARNPFDR